MAGYDATGSQKRAITKLCISLGIKEPVEEEQMSSGVAGKLIRELYARLRADRKQLRKWI